MKKPPYVNTYTDRHGKQRARFRRKGYTCPLPMPIGSDAFNAAYAAALTRHGKPAALVADGTFEALIQEYYSSLEYAKLKPQTQDSYRVWVERIRLDHGHRMVVDIEAKHIETLMTKLEPRSANKLHRYFRMLLSFSVRRSYRGDNPALYVKPFKIDGGHQTWPDSLIEQYQAHWPQGTAQRLLLDLALYTGLRRSDLATVHRSHIRDDMIRVVQQKTGMPLWVPIHANLAQSIDATPITGLYLTGTQAGNIRSVKALGGYFRKACERAGIPAGYSLHGLRKACATRLAEAGCSTKQIQAILGHATLSETERYTRDADQIKLAREAVSRMK